MNLVCWNGGGDGEKAFGIATRAGRKEELRFHLEMAELDALSRGQCAGCPSTCGRRRAGSRSDARSEHYPLAQRFPARQPAWHSHFWREVHYSPRPRLFPWPWGSARIPRSSA